MADVVFVHGAWVGPRCWEGWTRLYEAEGLRCVAPAWPHDDRPYEELRRAPDPALAGVGVAEIVEHYARIIEAMPEPPVLVGHSFGGLIVQLLISRGLGSAGVAVDPAPPRGVFPKPRALLTAVPVLLAWRGWKRVLTMTYEQFVSGFVHELPERARREAYEEHVIPTPGRPYFQAAFAPFHRATEVDFRRGDRAPLLIVAGERDRTAPPSMNRVNHAAYRHSSARTDFHEFPKRSHWIIAEPGWEEVAGYALSWVRALGAGAAGTPRRGAV
ncbi:alpha/beta hydrolase [Chondromyces apiculatus]|uniref:Putative Arylesterase-related protein n=1 Tax=Chondromyces apiculatus DSM 436 TaxID=1192034 RepID=A0A017TBV8_9BACT|nr:alpha/beta hydrolase [Chondromyces apiculatus]EYF06061.1 putative Arylesterase-related protein [Chondromyces apiculatus DSM 436]